MVILHAGGVTRNSRATEHSLSGGPFTEAQARLRTSQGDIMHASNHPSFRQPSGADRRRRHLAVYHRALRAADTPEQRAAVTARYRQLFTVTAVS